MRSDLIKSRVPSISRQTSCRRVQQRCPPPPLPVSLAAIFHHWIAHRRCQNSRPCVQFFFFSPFVSLDTAGMALSVLDNESVSIWLFVYPSVTQISSTPCSLQFDKLRRECGRRLWLMPLQCWPANRELIVWSKLVVTIIIMRRLRVKKKSDC